MCRSHIVVPAVAGGALATAALVLGVVLDPSSNKNLLIYYLWSAAILGVLTALIVWAVETHREDMEIIRADLEVIREDIRGATERVHAEVRAGNAYDSLAHRDDGSGHFRLRSAKPS